MKCDHIFCRNCLERWLGECEKAGRQKSCPKCRVLIAESINSTHAKSHVRPLKEANPLAFRLYQKIVVRCPLEGVRCGWRGELSEVLAHCSLHGRASVASGAASAAASSPATEAKTARERKSMSGVDEGSSAHRQAIALKEQANEFFASGNLASALQLYTRAIKLSPETAVFYSNRAACQLALARFDQALRDSNKCIAICEKDADRRARECRCFSFSFRLLSSLLLSTSPLSSFFLLSPPLISSAVRLLVKRRVVPVEGV